MVSPAATSVKIRGILAKEPRLKDLLRSIDSMQGGERTWELEKILGVAMSPNGQLIEPGNEDDSRGLRALAEAIEEIVRGERNVGLDWG